MTTISNDHDLRDALNRLSAVRRRIIGARFAGNIIHLCRNDRVVRAVDTALNPHASEAELQDAFAAAKSHTAKTYTDCGKDTDWLAQADHFVAAAAAAALTPPVRDDAKTNPAWKAAVQARMAKNCEMMEEKEGETDTEAERQYRIANQSL
jgi:hypothetical protein